MTILIPNWNKYKNINIDVYNNQSINFKSDLSDGLEVFCVLNDTAEVINLVNNNRYLATGASIASLGQTKNTSGIKLNTGTNISVPFIKETSNYTIIGRIYYGGGSVPSYGASIGTTQNSTPQIFRDADNWIYNIGGGNTNLPTETSFFQNSATIGVTVSSGVPVKSFINGKTATTFSSGTGLNVNYIRIGAFLGYNNSTSSVYNYVLGFSKVKSDSDIYEISNNPNQLLKPRVIYFDFGQQSSGIVTPGAGSVVYTGQASTEAQTFNQFTAPGSGSKVYTGQAPTEIIQNNVFTAPGTGSVDYTGQAPTEAQTFNQFLSLGNGAVTYTGQAPTEAQTFNQFIVLGVGSKVYTGQQSVINTGDSKTTQPGAGSKVYNGQAPTEAQTFNQFVSLGNGAITYTGQAPTEAQTFNQFVSLGNGAITYTGQAPTEAQTFNQFASLGNGAITYSGQQSALQNGGNQVRQLGVGEEIYAGQQLTADFSHSTLPGQGAILYSGAQPSESVTSNQVVTFGAGSKLYAGSASAVTNQYFSYVNFGTVAYTGTNGSLDFKIASSQGNVLYAGLTSSVVNNLICLTGSCSILYSGSIPVFSYSTGLNTFPLFGSEIYTGNSPIANTTRLVPDASVLRIVCGYPYKNVVLNFRPD